MSSDGSEIYFGISKYKVQGYSTLDGEHLFTIELGEENILADLMYTSKAADGPRSLWIPTTGPTGSNRRFALDFCTADTFEFEDHYDEYTPFNNRIVLPGRNPGECIAHWNSTYCDILNPVGNRTNQRYCQAFVKNPPYSCKYDQKRAFLEVLSLAFGFSELVQLGAITLIVFLLKYGVGGDEAKAKDDTDARSGRPRASTRGTNRGSNARQRKSRALEEANDATLFNAPDDALDAASTTSGYEEALESLAETSTPTGDESHGANGYLAVTGASEDQNNLKSSTLVPVQTYGENAADNEFAGFGGSDDSVQQADAGGFTVGQCGQPCIVAGVGSGTIRFVGLHAINGEPRVGVELNKPKGKNNGTVKGHTYFVCADGFGTLTVPSKITIQGTEL